MIHPLMIAYGHFFYEFTEYLVSFCSKPMYDVVKNCALSYSLLHHMLDVALKLRKNSEREIAQTAKRTKFIVALFLKEYPDDKDTAFFNRAYDSLQ